MGASRTSTRKLNIGKAKRLLVEEEATKLINEEDLKAQVIESV